MAETYKRPGEFEISLSLAGQIQHIALVSLKRSLTDRSEEELRVRFNPDSPDHVQEIRPGYEQYAKTGGLVLMYVPKVTPAVGFALVKEVEASPRGQQFQMKFPPASGNPNRIGSPHHRQRHSRYSELPTYAELVQVAVDPDYQHEGFEAGLIEAAVSPLQLNQPVVSELLEEDGYTKDIFAALGFALKPPKQQPNVIEGYFGPGSQAVHAYRYEAPSVGSVVNAARAKAVA
jgi:ribosomal protein S18 acetylase RimI-like enzyme